jgi:1-phosphatidylinositol-3-phosphate 5-kinase
MPFFSFYLNLRHPLEHVLPDSFVVVREDEPSTIIAYTLSCDDYLKKMNEMRDSATDTNALSSDAKDDLMDHSTATLSTAVDTEMTQSCIQDTLLKETGNHMRYRKFNLDDADGSSES